MLKTILFSLSGIKPMSVVKIHEDSVEMNIGLQKMYGFQLVSNIERIKSISADVTNKLLAVLSSTPNKLIYSIIRREKINNLYFDSIYYLSPNRDLLQILAENFGTLNIRKLKGHEIASVLYASVALPHTIKYNNVTGELQILRDYFTEDETGLIVSDRFNTLMKEIKPEDYEVYVGASHLGGVIDLERILKLNWEGSLFVMLDFNDQKMTIKRKKAQAVEHRDTFTKMQKKLQEGGQYVGVSLTFLSKIKDAQDLAVDLCYSFGFIPIKKEYEKLLYIYSPLFVRDTDYTFLLPPEDIAPYLIYTFEKTELPTMAEIFGRTRHNSFIAFSHFEENNAPHVMIFAPTGAGKSFGIQNMISNILRLDIGKLYKGEGDLTPLRNDMRIRHFDKGFSAELLYKLLKHRGYNVSIFNARVDDIKLNPCDVMNNDTEELEFSLYMINTCLQAIGLEPLVGYEASWYTKLLREASLKDEYKSFTNQAIEVLLSHGMDDIYEELIKLGYSSSTLIKDIKEPEFAFLKQVLLQDIARFLNSFQKSMQISQEERKALNSLNGKISQLMEYPTLTSPTKIDLQSSKLMYIDYEYLSTSKFFVPILLSLIKKLVFIDKYQKPENEKAIYIIDEAHNLLYNEYFNQALRILIREARKFRISLMFATQNFQDIPPSIIFNADTLMFLSPQEEERRKQYLKDFYFHISQGQIGDNQDANSSDMTYVYLNVPSYTFVVRYAKGVFSIQFDVDEYKKILFDSYRKSIELPDGANLIKSLVR